MGRDPAGVAPSSRGPRPTTLDGLDLHANVWVPRRDRGRLERLCRDVLQPPAAQERLQCRPDGRVLVASGWATGSWALMLSSTEAVVKPLLGCVVPCPVVTRRRHAADTRLTIRGPVAEEWMQRAPGLCRPAR